MIIQSITIDFHTFIDNFMTAIEAKDSYTAGHSDRVAEISILIAKEMNLDEELTTKIHIAAHLHDIGKIGIPDGILLKSGKLTKAEYEVIKSHSEIGYNILKNNKDLEDMALMVLYHHEKYNGLGYPEGISGLTIPLGARIICVADAFDAMVTQRTYKDKLTLEAAIQELINQSGKHFDPQVVDTFVKLLQYKKFLKALSLL